MNRYKNMMIGMNLSDLDKSTLRYASMINRLGATEKVYFIHVTRYLMTPQKILDEYPNLLQPLDEYAEGKLRDSVEHYFQGPPELQKHFEVIEGNPLDEMLRRMPQREIELVVLGRKHDTAETRMLPLNLTRKAPASVLIVPDGAAPEINRILLPLDFSECSSHAMDIALEIAEAAKVPNILCLHAYQLPLGYYKTGKSEAEFTRIMEGNARSDFSRMLHGRDTRGIQVSSLFVKDKNPVNAIRKAAAENHIDLIVMGARGRGAGAAALIGSVTENLIRSIDIPVIAVKRKGIGMNFLKALFQLEAH